ncbi:hypothetical protein HUJ05_003657 [Dendroctonus ponderosae]|nr:hypothetical protein HUJ05_003657 [Dendroctonus ponderosae]
MNLHNNEAGRWHVQSLMRRECKCHGMSGSCTMRTCWMKLTNFRTVSDVLKERYDKPAHIAAHSLASSKPNKPHANRFPKGSTANSIPTKRENKRKHKYGFQLKPYNSEFKPPGDKDLVYYELSPAFCEKNPEFGIQVCNLSNTIELRGPMDENVMVLQRELTIVRYCVVGEDSLAKRTNETLPVRKLGGLSSPVERNTAASDRTGKINDDSARKRNKRRWKPKTIRIGCWNVTSLNNKDQKILLEMGKHKIDDCIITETKKKGQENSKCGKYFLDSGVAAKASTTDQRLV